MEKVLKAGLIGCGDYLRWLIDDINASQRVKVKSTFDLDSQKSEHRASQLNAVAVQSAEAIFNDPEITIVYLFTPPFARKELFEKAVAAGKHIITTKPLANSLQTAEYLHSLTHNKVHCAVFYGRTGNASVKKLKDIFDSGEIGQLALYKEDWFHHYPQWNNWATDREKNGGPFMDAMIHNLNKARYLIGAEVATFNYISENLAQQLKCNDTEFLKLNFGNGASSYLFITWAADLEVYSLQGNEREHYGILHLITDQGWYVKETTVDGQPAIEAKKENQVKTWKVEPLQRTPYDDFALSVMNGTKPDFDISDALTDIRIIDAAVKGLKSIN